MRGTSRGALKSFVPKVHGIMEREDRRIVLPKAREIYADFFLFLREPSAVKATPKPNRLRVPGSGMSEGSEEN